MSAPKAFQYPNINVPPIVYKNEIDKKTRDYALSESSDIKSLNDIVHSAPAPSRQKPLSFVPSGINGVLIPMEGDVSHPDRHVLTNTKFISPTRSKTVEVPPKNEELESEVQEEEIEDTLSQEDFHQMEQAKKGYTPITRADEEAMKFYVAGMGVVSMLILYKIMY